jgi:hypothetical protein
MQIEGGLFKEKFLQYKQDPVLFVVLPKACFLQAQHPQKSVNQIHQRVVQNQQGNQLELELHH